MEGSEKRENHIFYISLLNVLACFAVIMLHCNGFFWSRPHGRAWITANLIEVTMYFAVPVFFMNIGVTGLDYPQKYSTKEFLGRRFKKVVIPFLFWSVFSLLVSVVLNGTEFNFVNVYDSIVKSAFMSIYWFFIPLIAVYLSLPLLSGIPAEKRKSIFGYLIIYAVVTVSILPLLCNLLKLKFNTAIQPPVAASYIVYVLIGYWIHHYPISGKIRSLIYCMGIVGWMLHFFGTLAVSAGESSVVGTFKGYLNIPCVMYSAAIFVFFRYLDYEKAGKRFDKLKKVIITISKLTFGVYLVHMYLINFLLSAFKINRASIHWRIGGSFLVFGISCVIVFIAQKIPVLRKIVPK